MRSVSPLLLNRYAVKGEMTGGIEKEHFRLYLLTALVTRA